MNDPSRATEEGGRALKRGGPRRLAEACCTVAGIGGSLLCSFGMVAAAVGLFAAAGTAAAKGSSMTGMGTTSGSRDMPGWLDVIVRFGPQILVASLLLVALGVGLRRRRALVPVVAGGGILYLGMYGQSDLAWMSVAIAVGTVLLILAYAVALRPRSGSWLRGT